MVIPRWVVGRVLVLRGSKRTFRSRARSEEARERGALLPTKYHPPAGMLRRLSVSVDGSADGWPVYAVQSRTYPDVAVDVVYLHGGAYIQQITSTHWSFIEDLAQQTGARVLVPIYPLAPLSTAANTVPRTVDLVATFLRDQPHRRVVLMGDSAGAGLALTVAQALTTEFDCRPDQLILISPWLEVGMTAPGQRDIARHDPMLAAPGLIDAGQAYAGDLPSTDPRVSPLHGSHETLPPTLCFTGTADILSPDAEAFAARASDAGATVELDVAHGEFHVYPLLPTPRGRRARQRIYAAIRRIAA